MRCTLLPTAQRTAAPWKNGGGRTWEIAIGPADAGLDDFDWRISMARVDTEGPFSRFPGIVRTLAVLEGALRLRVQAQPAGAIAQKEYAMRLDRETAPWRFDGDVPVHAEVIAPVLDLNLMHRPNRCHASLQRMDDGDALVETPVAFFLATAPMRLAWTEPTGLEGHADLQIHDALRLDEATGVRLQWPVGVLGYSIRITPRPQ